jgi:hypothetical protein
MASFKYLRTLGKHLKSVSNSPGLFQKFVKMNDFSKNVNLNSYANNKGNVKLDSTEKRIMKMLNTYKKGLDDDYDDELDFEQ